MTCNIVSPETSIVIENVKYVQVPGTMGCFGIMPKHAHLVSALEPGNVRITYSDKSQGYYSLPAGGFVEVNNDFISIVAESITETFG